MIGQIGVDHKWSTGVDHSQPWSTFDREIDRLCLVWEVLGRSLEDTDKWETIWGANTRLIVCSPNSKLGETLQWKKMVHAKKSPAGILRPMCDSHKHDSVSLFWRFWFLSTHLLFILEGFQGMTNPTKIHKQIGIGKNIITGKSKVRKCCRWYFMLTIVMVVVMMEQVVIMVSSWTC